MRTDQDLTTLKAEWREFFASGLAHNQKRQCIYPDPDDQRYYDLRIERIQGVLDTVDACDAEVITEVQSFFDSPDKNRASLAQSVLHCMLDRVNFSAPVNAEAFFRELTRRLEDLFKPLTKKELIAQLTEGPAQERIPPFPDETPVEIGFQFNNDAGESFVPIGIVNRVSWTYGGHRGCRIQLVLVAHEGCQWDQDKHTVTFNYHTANAAAHKDDPKPAATDADTAAVDGFDALLRSMKEGFTGEAA
jgi:hypothetical protein